MNAEDRPDIGLIDNRGTRIVLALLLGIGLVLFLLANTRDYCIDQRRALSNEEFIEIAVRDASSKMHTGGSDSSNGTFRIAHPNCCRVQRNMGSFLDTIFGFATAEVEMYYELNNKSKARYGTDYYHQYTVINRCGDVGRTYGEAIRKSAVASWAN